jgi:uncharacterized phiE125 gp8 family phage protein
VKITLTTAPTDDAVGLQEMQDHSRIRTHHDVATLDRLLKDAQRAAEGYLRRKLITQTWTQYFDAFNDPLELRFPPLSSVTSVSYLDIDGDTQVLAETVWEAGEENGIGVVRLKYGQVWPATRSHEDVVIVPFVCGYGDQDDVPEPIKQAIRCRVAHFYRHRESGEVPPAFFDLLRPFRAFQFVKTYA